jgi:hypothetical protein
LQECLRILKPGGNIIFTVDTLENITDPDLIEKHRGDHHVMQYFRKDTLGNLLTGIGFENLALENLFRSPLATELFTRGIKQGFNFGRLRTQFLARDLARAEAPIDPQQPGIFMLATASKPLA